MKPLERVIGSLERRGFDRLPMRHMAEPVVNQMLMEHFGIDNHMDLLDRLGDDLRYVQPEYCGPAPKTFPDGSRELAWPDRGWPVPTRYIDQPYSKDSDAFYTEASYRPFKNIEGPSELDRFNFPTADWIDYTNFKKACEKFSGYAIVTGSPGILDFINGISHSRGLEQVFMDIALEDPVYLKLMEKKFEYHYEMTRRTLEAAEGLVTIVQTGEDLGIQERLVISPAKFTKLFAPKFRVFFEMVHQYNAKTMLHCCGSVYDLIAELIELGLDILDVVQVSAVNMGIRKLHTEFGKDLSFCGTMCVQTTLPESTPEEIKKEVDLRLELFHNGGLILAPSHLIQPDTPIDNILTMYNTVLQTNLSPT